MWLILLLLIDTAQFEQSAGGRGAFLGQIPKKGAHLLIGPSEKSILRSNPGHGDQSHHLLALFDL